MDNARFLLPFVVLALLGLGCSTSTSVPAPLPSTAIPVTTIGTRPGVLPPAAVTPGALEACLARTGATLTEIQAVNNNDTTAHGDIVTFAVSSDRRLAVAAQDGSVKFWSLDGFLGVAGGPVLTYGPEVPTALAADLAWLGDRVAVGDVSGLVTDYDVAGDSSILGGVEPGTAITAVATTGDGTLLAHADVRSTGHVTVRSMSGTDVVGPLAVTMDGVHDLAFLPDDTLIVAGGLASPWPSAAVLERWDTTPGAPVQLVRYQAVSGTDFSGVATSLNGDVVAAVSADVIAILDGALNERVVAPLTGAGNVGVAVTLGGHFALTAGSDGLVRALDTTDAHQVTSLGVADPVAIRIDPAGELLFVASRGGLVHAYACRAD